MNSVASHISINSVNLEKYISQNKVNTQPGTINFLGKFYLQ